MQKFSTDITPEEADEIKKFAAIFMTPKEIAIIMEKDQALFTMACMDEGNLIFNAFQAGRLLSEFELRAAVIKLAKSGSSPAQTMAFEMLKNSKLKMMDS